MAIQFISTNKNYKRLYNAPLDPSFVWDDISKLREYLNDPTCYVDQLVGCNGKAYIIIEKDGVKDIKEIGTIDYFEEYDSTIEELRTIINNMNEEIKKLKDRVLYLENNGNIGTKDEGLLILYEDNTIIVTENNEIIIY